MHFTNYTRLNLDFSATKGDNIHDHDKTFYSYGTKHQECTQHDCRYLTGSKENEPDLEWNHQMHALFQEMLHYRNGLGGGGRT